MKRLERSVQSGFQIKPWGGAILIWQNSRSGRHLCLPGNPVGDRDSALFQAVSDYRYQLFVMNEIQAQQIRYDFARDIVSRWAQAAGYEQNVASGEKLSERILHR